MGRGAGMTRGSRWTSERSFHVGFAAALLAAVLLGFSRTFFLRPWFPEWARAHSAPEPFFYVHGAVFFAWFVLLLAQPALVAAGRVDLHRRLGWLGAGLAAAMLVLGTAGALLAARRPTGFMDVPVPPLRFLAFPLGDMALFGAFVALALVTRRKTQSHKRYMLLASVGITSEALWILRRPQARVPLQMPAELRRRPWTRRPIVRSGGFSRRLANESRSLAKNGQAPGRAAGLRRRVAEGRRGSAGGRQRLAGFPQRPARRRLSVADGREAFPAFGQAWPEAGQERRTAGNGWPDARQRWRIVGQRLAKAP